MTEQLAAEVAERFRLGPVHGWSDLGGTSTTNLRLQLDGPPVVARVHPSSTSKDRVRAMRMAKDAVARAGVPTATGRPAADGSMAVALGDGRIAEVEAELRWDTPMKTPALLSSGFGALATVHDALRQAPLPQAASQVDQANHVGALDVPAAVAPGIARVRRWADPTLTDYADRAQRHLDVVHGLERELVQGQLVHVVHGDFWDDNVLFRGDELVGVVDFGFMARRPRVDDLALTTWFWLLEPASGPPGPPQVGLVAAWLRSYDAAAEIPLSAGERRALPLSIARQPGWSLGRWISELPEGPARAHAHAAADELAVAETVLRDLELWQDTLERGPA
ncbi:phosphotransferase [Serinicoccus kebangsaanensis]|uniref:phosphotransferase n=1 Tax=Serinicoccus kebangsaanensis TaxID=2602069 RepID=UPI00192D669B|nr:phosphotransferase [Serinicoccus kebangsaanensis]